MQEMAKPIETKYNGYRFRSRLEARWAVFFDECDIEYEYEPEGYDLDGVWYLPDFYLPKFELFVEIKPGSVKPFAEYVQERVEDRYCAYKDEVETLLKRFRDTTGRAILLLCGDPLSQSHGLLFAWSRSDYGCSNPIETIVYETKFMDFGETPWYRPSDVKESDRVWILADYTPPDYEKVYLSSDGKSLSRVHRIDYTKKSLYEQANIAMTKELTSGFLYNAMEKARQARFEYGETPRGKRR